ncbi:MAG: DDE-type integrase/transposase/recombinase [Gammaproteobacteria bacterium]|nr:DDE-type integrase/transposase/recombinase [Gammaproteobacteria bacterium]
MPYIGSGYSSDIKSYRLCAISQSGEYFALSDMARMDKGNFEKPIIFTLNELDAFCRSNSLTEREYELPPELSFSDKALTSKGRANWLQRRDAKWLMLHPLTTPSLIEQYLFGDGINQLVSEHVNNGGWANKSAYYRALNRFIALGMTKNALLPVRLKNSGSKCPTYKTVADVKAKRGRKSILTVEQTRGVCEADKRNILAVVKKFKAAGKKFSLQAAYQLFDANYQRTEMLRELDDGSVQKIIIPFAKNDCLSYDQFYYHFRKLIDADTLAKIQYGHLKYAKDIAPRTGSARDGIVGATHRYEVDATVLDLYVSYPYKAGLSAGRPVLYLVVDVYSSMIVGMYLGFSGPDWSGVAQALANACLDKVEFARRYAVDISENEWPAHHIPREITIDNGREYRDCVISSALKSLLGINAVNLAAAYRGDCKGTVERAFGIINDSIIHHLSGSIFKQQERTESHPSNAATYTYQQVVGTLIREIIYQNKSADRLKKLGFKAAIDGCGISPEAIYLHSLLNDMAGGRPTTANDQARVYWAFLPEEEATVTDHGISFDGLEYIAEHPLIIGMFSTATKKRFKIPIKRLKDYVNCLWYQDNSGEFIRLDLKNVNNENRYLGLPWEIVEHRLYEEKVILSGAQEDGRYLRAERDAKIEEIFANTDCKSVFPVGKTSSRKSIQPGMKQRKAEQHKQIRIAEGAVITRALTHTKQFSSNNPAEIDLYDLDNELFN